MATTTQQLEKPFWQSKTFWGLVITLIGVFAPKLAPVLQGSLDDIFTIIGLILTLIGRFRATGPLTLTTKVKEPTMKNLLFLILLLPLLALSTVAQDRQVGLLFNIQTPSKTFTQDTSLGISGDAYIPFGEYLGVQAGLGYQRRNNSAPAADLNIFQLGADLRYYPQEAGRKLAPFAGVGYDLQHLYGPLAHTRVSPTFGAGFVFAKRFSGGYVYAIPDLTSTFKERSHRATFDAYIPFRGSYLLRGRLQYRRTNILAPTLIGDNQVIISLGVARKF